MAGVYRRFREAGYTRAKFLLPWRGRPLLAHIINELCAGFSPRRLLLLGNERDRGSEPELRAILAGCGHGAATLAWTVDTDGQATTALLALDRLEQPAAAPAPVFFHNIDTLLCGRDLAEAATAMAAGADGWIDVFRADSPAYSYVAVDPAGRVTAIREKEVISPWATSGLYGFGSPALYRTAYHATQAAGSERYISAVYARLIADGGCVLAPTPAAAQQTLVFGTPAEYEALVAAG